MQHFSASPQAQAALTGILASEKVVLQDIVNALQTDPPPTWVASLVPFKAEIIPALEFIMLVQGMMPNTAVVPVPTQVPST